MQTHYFRIFSLIILAAAVLIAGCDSSSVPVVSQPQSEVPDIESYFPLAAGSVLDFSVANEYTGISSTERFVVGKGVSDGSKTSYQWIHTNLAYPDRPDTGYFVRTSSALYYYENSSADPQVILEAPFKVGQSWNRLTRTRTGQNLVDSLTGSTGSKYDNENSDNGEKDYEDDGTGEGGLFDGGVGKNFPLIASGFMTITAIEDITLTNGETFHDCIKVESKSGSKFTNIYWYAEDYGLVKYIIGAATESLTAGESPDGQVVGELIRH